MDIVYPLKNTRISHELIYSLRSLVNIPHDKVFFVGGCPVNINKNEVIYVPTQQTSTKWKNSIENIKHICKDERLSDDFILMNDDFFVLKPVTYNDLNITFGTLRSAYIRYSQNGKTETSWTRGLRETANILEKYGIQNPLSYELHTPFIFNKHKYAKIFEVPGALNLPVLQTRSVYGNLFYTNSKKIEDVKVLSSTVFNENNYDKFLSCSDSSFAKIQPFLSKKFSVKCKYEL